MVVGKLVLSVISVSFFMLVNAMYSTGMGLARFVALKMHEQERTKQIRGYRNVGIIIMLASFCYVLYSIRLFYGEKTGSYPMEISLAIAAYTFVEFGIVIRDIFRLRKSHALEAKALRAISLAATLLCFVITQTAIMSFSEASDATFSNALSGIFFGAIAMLVGVYVIIRSQIIKKRSEV